MDRSSATLLEFIARLTYNVDGLSGKLRLYFSQFLTFHFSKTLSLNQIQDIENSKAARSFKDEQEIIATASNLTEDEKCWAIASIELLRAEAGRLDDRVVSRRLNIVTSDLIRILGLTGSTGLIEAHRKSIEEELRRYEERPVVRIPAAIWPLSLDFFLRCAALMYLSVQDIDKSILAPINFPLIPIIVLALVLFYRRRNKKANLQLLEKYGGIDKYKTEFHMSATQYTWLALFLITSTFISYLLAGTHQLGPKIHILAFVWLVAFYLIYLRFFNVGKISENDLVRQLDEKEQRTDTLGVDENDEMIVSLETRLNSSTSRLDAYVLESALFGALTFSGFLQIMASNLVSFTDLEVFASAVFTTSRAIIHLDGAGFKIGLALLNSNVSLFCLVSVESLVCSIFFVAVIASRLRFSDIADKVRTAINLARAFNEKEEALYHESETSDVRQSRLNTLTAKVNRQLFAASQSLRKVDPVMAYMQYFRNAGILVFLLILISSSLFITSVLSWTFLAAAGATYFYFNRERISLNFRATFLQLRIVFLRQAVWLFLIAVTPFLVAMIARNSFYWLETPGLLALGYFLVGLHLAVWLLLASHYDQEFGDIEKKENHKRLSRWNIVRNLLAAVIFLFCLGMAFKHFHLSGADEMIMLGASAMSPLMFFTGYFLSRIRWLGVISGWLLGSATVGLLFKTLHLYGADEMLIIGTISASVFTVVILWKRTMFHSLYLRFCLALLFLSAQIWTGLFLRLDIAYAHKTTNLAPIMRVLEDQNRGDFITEGDVSKAVEATDWYMDTYGNTVPYTAIYQDIVRMYEHFGQDVAWQAAHNEKRDTTTLENALTLVRERDRVTALFGSPAEIISRLDMTLEPELLLRLNRNEEAVESLNILVKRLEGLQDQQQELVAKLASIKAM